jgi:5-formyltetrahydrofolate cyclo-ligase
MHSDLRQLRRNLKTRRASLERAEIASASLTIAANFWRMPCVQRVSNIGIYMATAGEIDCGPLIKMGWLRKKRIFAPVLAKNQLKFAALNPDSKLLPNRFDILEPVYRDCDLIGPRQLNIVIVPLLAFDIQLNRIGMGAGYYDRTFAFIKRQRLWRHPLLIGVAHCFQQVDELQAQPWDVRLHTIITEQECFRSN